jgi:hypothetical protein
VTFCLWRLGLALLAGSAAACNLGGGKVFEKNLQQLVAAQDADQEEHALGELLRAARKDRVDYGYKVFSESAKSDVPVEDIQSHLDETLRVTILIGSKPPYREVVWRPKYNGHITRLVVP